LYPERSCRRGIRREKGNEPAEPPLVWLKSVDSEIQDRSSCPLPEQRG
jgi:hypothetical protein